MSYDFDISGSWTLTAGQIWPDGDGPENPTVEDVLEVLRPYISLRHLMSEWNLDPTLTVDGHEVRL